MNKLAWFISSTLILTAVLSLSLRFTFPYINVYKNEIAQRLSQALNIEIDVDGVEINLYGYTPVVILRDVMLGKETGSEYLYFDLLHVEINPWQSFFSQRIAIEKMHAKGGKLFLSYHADGQIHIANMPAFSTKKEAIAISEMDDFNLYMRDINIFLDNQLVGKVYEFKQATLILAMDAERVHFVLESELPESLGDKILIKADMKREGITNVMQWEGNIKVQAKKMKLEEWTPLFAPEEEYTGIATLNIQSQLAGDEFVSITGTFDCQLCSGDDWKSVNFNTDFSWYKDQEIWQFALSDAQLKMDEIAFAESTFIARQYPEHTDMDIAIHLPRFKNKNIRFITDTLGIKLEQFSISDMQGSLSLVSNLDKLANMWILKPQEYIKTFTHPEIINHQSTYLDVYLHDGQLHFMQVDKVLPYESLSATIAFAQFHPTKELAYKTSPTQLFFVPSTPAYVIVADEIDIQTGNTLIQGKAGKSDMRDGNARIAATLDIKDVQFNEVKQWLPNEKNLFPEFIHWLQEAVVQGDITHGHLEFAGKPENFPFIKQEGHIYATAEIKNTEIIYRKQHEPLQDINGQFVLAKDFLAARVSHLRYHDIEFNDTLIRIDDIYLPYLEIDTQGEGELKNMIQHLKQVNLVDAKSFFLKNLKFEGDGRLNVHVGKSLSKKVSQPMEVYGTLDFLDSSIRILPSNNDVKNIRGSLDFNQLASSAKLIHATIDGTPILIKVKTEEGITLLSAEGNFPSQYLMKEFSPELIQYVEGSSSWKIDLELPNLKSKPSQNKGRIISLSSDLQGSEFSFPSPFAKKRIEKKPLNLDIQINQDGKQYQFTYADIVRGLITQPKETKNKLSGHIHFGEEEPQLETSGFYIDGQIKQVVSIDAWMKFKRQHSVSNGADYLYNVNLKFNNIFNNQQNLGGGFLNIETSSNTQKEIYIDSDFIKGTVYVHGQGDNKWVQADMKYFFLKEKKKNILETFSSGIDMQSLPKSDIQIENFEYGDLNGNDVVLLLNPIPNGTAIEKFKFNVGSVTAVISGEWMTQKKGSAYSTFVFSSSGEDYGNLFSSWNISHDFVDGDGKMSGHVSWLGSPTDFDLNTLQGNINVNFEDGILKNIKPGVGKLLGLLNIGHIVRRLSLDFKDMFSEGLVFDKLSADFQFKDGNLVTDNFFLKGTSLNLKLKGRIGLTARDYDQQIEVIPNLSASLPVAALLAGPVAAASVYILDLITGLGDKLNETLVLRYTVTGSWDNPEVKHISSSTEEVTIK